VTHLHAHPFYNPLRELERLRFVRSRLEPEVEGSDDDREAMRGEAIMLTLKEVLYSWSFKLQASIDRRSDAVVTCRSAPNRAWL
jgi:hypothetical protein